MCRAFLLPQQRPIGLDGAHEQSASAGSGIGDAHRDEPVNTEPTTAESELSPSAVSVSDEIELPESVGRGNLAEETAAAIGLPAPEQQQETIRQLQHRASWQPPIKDDGTHIDEQDIVDVLVMGSGFCEGRFRIQEFFSATVLPTVKEQADWLKKEYGIGGRTWDFRDGERGFLDYDAKGLRIKRYASDNAPDHFRLLPWNEVARRLHLLVHNDKYLDENNKQGYEKWEAEQKAKRDARQAEIDYAEKTIADFCEHEGLGAPDYSDLTHIDLAYTTNGSTPCAPANTMAAISCFTVCHLKSRCAPTRKTPLRTFCMAAIRCWRTWWAPEKPTKWSLRRWKRNVLGFAPRP